MEKMIALLVVSITGFFFLIGPLLNKFFKDTHNLTDIVMGMAIVVTIGLIVLDLLPECFHMFEEYGSIKYFYIIGFIILGMLILRIIDKLIPHHQHDHNEKELNHNEHHGHLEHIGLLTAFPIIIHNILEGTMIYSASIIDINTGIMFAITVIMHNIPLSMQITASLKDKMRRVLIITLLILSTPIGGLLMILLFNTINTTLFACLLAITLGMLIYIIIFELLREIIYNSNKKYALLGIVFGIIFILFHFIGQDHHIH